MSGSQPGPLSGVQVLDFTHNLPGPYATFVLASLGARVIKVEPPRGDAGRHMEPFFSLLNRGKKSVALDLRDPASREPLERLVRGADVLVEGFRPGVMARLGCDWETARAWNPRLIYCSISAYGQEGPRAAEPGHDLNAQSLAGACALQTDATGRPDGLALPVADFSAALSAVASICAALAGRSADGGGVWLDVAMTDALVGWTQIWGMGVDLGAPVRERLDAAGLTGKAARPLVHRGLLAELDRRKLYAMPHYGVYRAGDGRWLALGVVDEDHFWRALCEVTGLKRFAGLGLSARTALGPVLRPLIARRLRRRTQADWLTRFAAAGVPVTPVLTPDQARQEPQFVQRDLFDAAGLARAPLPQSAHIRAPAPTLGEHNAEILGSPWKGPTRR